MKDYKPVNSEISRSPNGHSIALILVFGTLLTLGMFNLYSAAVGTKMVYFTSQLKHMFISLCVFSVFAWGISVKHLNTYTFIFYGLNVLLLVFVLSLGHTAGGSQRWISVFGINFQPSETAKIVVAMFVAKFFYNNKQVYAYTLRDLWPLSIGVLGVFLLIFKQPDLGTGGLCLLIALSQVVFIRINLKSIGTVIATGAVSAVVGWNFLLHPYQKLRILNLLNPNLDPSGSGYNSLQSLVAIGSGGIFGKGYLEGTQSQLQFLPARHTDFIFSVFAEEHGFWGGIFVFVMFAVLTFIGLEIARAAKDSYNSLLAIGLTSFIFLEFLINVSMVIGLFPVVGMPLPLFSYGGSSLLTICMALGMLVSIDRDNMGVRQNKIPGGL